jgi:predicted RNase H-like nuclease (RuvC/YqgF family)
MKTRFRTLLPLVLAAAACTSLHAKKVSRVTGHMKPPSSGKEETAPDRIRLENESQIESALEKVRQNDIQYYRYLMRLKKQSLKFTEFLSRLEDWINKYDVRKINHERYRLNRRIKELSRELEELSAKYRDERDDESRKRFYETTIRQKVREWFQARLALEEIAVRVQKLELARLETRLEQTRGERDDFEKQMLERYLPKESPDEIEGG